MRSLWRAWGWFHIIVGTLAILFELPYQMWGEAAVSAILIVIGYALINSHEPETLFQRIVEWALSRPD